MREVDTTGPQYCVTASCVTGCAVEMLMVGEQFAEVVGGRFVWCPQVEHRALIVNFTSSGGIVEPNRLGRDDPPHGCELEPISLDNGPS